MRPDKIFFSLALCALLLIAGGWLHRKFIAQPRITTTIKWYEKPIFIPAKTETKPAVAKPTAETVKRDTIWQTAPCDSVRRLAQHLSQPMSATFEDTIAVSDSLGSFWARELTTIEADPWTRLITKTQKFEDAILKVARVETTETVTETDWIVTLAAFIAGLLLAIFST